MRDSAKSSNRNKSISDVIAELQWQINNDQIFVGALTASLIAARDKADRSLDPALFTALKNLYSPHGWPIKPSGYIDYLNIFYNTIPCESDFSYAPWKSTNTQNGYSQEVFDRLCHFYWLVDQAVGDITLQKYTNPNKPPQGFSFSDWLDDYANAWGDALNNSGSLTQTSLQSFKNDPGYNTQDYSDDESNWKSFNTFFFRQLNSTRPDGTPMRPVANPDDNTIICSPADCRFKAIYGVDSQGNIVDQSGNPASVILKKTHPIGTIGQLLGDDYANEFNGGTFVHYFLSPFDYHRFHSPVSGTVLSIKAVHGKVYLAVDITSDHQFDAPDDAEDGYEFTQARGVLVIDTGDQGVGKVAVAPIGMAQVSSVMLKTELLGTKIQKGQEFGQFAFGGSDIIMVFQRPVEALKFVKNVANAQTSQSYRDPDPFHFQYGQPSVIVCS